MQKYPTNITVQLVSLMSHDSLRVYNDTPEIRVSEEKLHNFTIKPIIKHITKTVVHLSIT